MFGTVSACRHVVGEHGTAWTAAMCGVCLAVRDRAGQVARATVSTDAIATAVLAVDLGTAAGGPPPPSRRAGPCPLRGMRSADVWVGPAVSMAAGVGLLTAAVTLQDRAHDGQLPAPRVSAGPAVRYADRLDDRAAAALVEAGIDVRRIRAALGAARAAEQRASTVLGDWTEPVADAYGAVLDPLGMAELGRRLGRATLLADAVADVDDDLRDGSPNPIVAGACSAEQALRVVEQDVTTIGSTVETAVPGSLAAALWGAGLRRGMTAIVRPVRLAGDPANEPVWPSWDSDAGHDHEPTDGGDARRPGRRCGRRRHRRSRSEPRSSWLDCCDCCLCLECCDC